MLDTREKFIQRKGLSNFPVAYHLVDASPWPLFASFATLVTTIGGTMYMHGYENGGLVVSLGTLMLVYSMVVWWRDVVREATYQGCHTRVVQVGLRYGVLLFIVSEVMFFLAFFWAFFHSSLSPTVDIGGVWPPKGIEVLSPWELPALNTLLLLSSGASVTWCHHALICGKRKSSLIALGITIGLAVIFTFFQGVEYKEAGFTISDGIYGSCFYLATGFHGFHVIIGTLFLGVCWVRLYRNHFTSDHHFGVESSIFYWHFVDVVWLFLFVSIYYWGGK